MHFRSLPFVDLAFAPHPAAPPPLSPNPRLTPSSPRMPLVLALQLMLVKPEPREMPVILSFSVCRLPSALTPGLYLLADHQRHVQRHQAEYHTARKPQHFADESPLTLFALRLVRLLTPSVVQRQTFGPLRQLSTPVAVQFVLSAKFVPPRDAVDNGDRPLYITRQDTLARDDSFPNELIQSRVYLARNDAMGFMSDNPADELFDVPFLAIYLSSPNSIFSPSAFPDSRSALPTDSCQFRTIDSSKLEVPLRSSFRHLLFLSLFLASFRYPSRYVHGYIALLWQCLNTCTIHD
ncbi:hypothetical protein B0H14DRAFT_2576526 [Mycena olivaceomarginata]|nr:hypothetical protein B0H14DRAFT_2576526 [Mycena olivaceomarginata]